MRRSGAPRYDRVAGEKRNLSREDAYTLCSLAADLRVTQTVNGSKGIHCMIAKAIVHG
jgi:acetamidase/formamidase